MCLHLPLEVAYKKGYFDAELNQILTDPSDDTKGFFDPKTKDNLTYMEMLGRCVRDKETGLFLLPLDDKPGTKAEMYTDTEIKKEFEKTGLSISVGRYSGKSVSLWDLIHSGYFTEEQRKTPKMIMGLRKPVSANTLLDSDILNADTFKQVKEGTLTFEAATQCESVRGYLKGTGSITCKVPDFHGIRKEVSATELLESKIITEELYKDLSSGKVTVTEVSEMDSVSKYLEGTNSIAGVYVQSTMETLSIFEAKGKGLLTPGTSLVLLEAQAATGFVIDPVNNKKLSVEEAVAQGVVGSEWKNKLLSAERAVTGYKDPYTGNTISLFQALKKDLIVKNHGIRLLEAQIATGGIIDPVYSHRVPVQVAYERGYFDEEMNQILSDPDDDTKGFFDPNTKENLTYLQLVERCVTDPITGFSLLVIVKKGDFVLISSNSRSGQYPLWKIKYSVLLCALSSFVLTGFDSV
uniref:Epiplakin 1 n=1 Tax=Seriola dumerili TaxID=41447 RepID=A0A3B4U8M4_SERDU